MAIGATNPTWRIISQDGRRICGENHHGDRLRGTLRIGWLGTPSLHGHSWFVNRGDPNYWIELG